MKQRTWAQLSHAEKKRIITRGRALGWTDERIAAKYGVRKNAVVGFRHRYLPELTGRKRGFGMPEEPPAVAPEPERAAEPEVPLPVPETAEKPGSCEWPIVQARGRIVPCNQPTAPGERLCEAHKLIARSKVHVHES